MKFKIISIYIIFTLCSSAKSQTYIKGKIIDENNNPISNVNIFFKNKQQQGTISDEQGYFEIISQKDSLIFSHLIYETKIIKPDTSNIIILKKKSFQLDEIVISSEKNYLVIKNPWIIDYEITTDNIFIAYVSNRGPVIEIRDLSNNILYQESSNEFIAFEKDCIGNMYLHINKSYLLIDFKSFYYKIIKSYNETEFNKIKYSCDVKIKEYQFYNYFVDEKYNLIFNYNSITKDYILLNVIADKNDIHYIKELQKENVRKLKELDNINKKINDFKILGKKNSATNNKLEYEIYRLQNEINTDLLFKDFVQKKKINSPIFGRNDTLYIFDNINNTLFKYLFNGTYLKNTSFMPPFSNPIFIIQDLQNLTFFHFYKVKNKIEIYKYNINKNIFEYNISVKNKIEKPMIINNKLYFIEYDNINQTKLLKAQWLN